MSGDITEYREGACSHRGQRIERIEALLRELEVLSHSATDVPLPLVLRALTTIEQARAVLRRCADAAARAAADAEEGDPQPDIDSEILERMYRSLGTGRPPPKR